MKLKKLRIGTFRERWICLWKFFFFKRGEGKFEVNLARMKRKREREGGREKEREEEIFCRKFIFGYFVCICI